MVRGTSAPSGARPKTSAELGRWGEALFTALCAKVSLVPHKPTYDLNGWDFLVEFPHPATKADTDTAGRQEPLQCFVQVKAVWEGRREVDLGLSAAARLGKSALPSFLCILEASEAMELRRLHVLHMAGPLLERVLRKLREMQAENRSTFINKASFRVQLPKRAKGLQPRGDALIRAIEEAVGPDHAAYRRQKDNFLRTAGFPTLPVAGTVQVKIDSDADYSDFLLGLKPLPVVSFDAVETRWGIGIPIQLDATPATVQAVPQHKDVAVVWRLPKSSKVVRLKMRAILAPGSASSGRAEQWHITHPNVELKINGSTFVMNTVGPSAVPTSYRAMVQLHALETLMAARGPVELQLIYQGKLMRGWEAEGPLELHPAEDLDALGEILREVGVVLAAAGVQDVQLPSGPWGEWRKQVLRLHNMLEATGHAARIVFEVPDEGTFEDKESEALYVSAVEFEGQCLAYYATCRARFEQEEEPKSWALHASDFIIRDLRLIESSEAGMMAFSKEAEAIIGLTTTILTIGTLAEPSAAHLETPV